MFTKLFYWPGDFPNLNWFDVHRFGFKPLLEWKCTGHQETLCGAAIYRHLEALGFGIREFATLIMEDSKEVPGAFKLNTLNSELLKLLKAMRS